MVARLRRDPDVHNSLCRRRRHAHRKRRTGVDDADGHFDDPLQRLIELRPLPHHESTASEQVTQQPRIVATVFGQGVQRSAPVFGGFRTARKPAFVIVSMVLHILVGSRVLRGRGVADRLGHRT